jgi:hypothetical protein
MKGEATDHYLWSNTEYAFWIDDTSIDTNTEKTYAIFDIIFEDLRSHEQLRYADPTIIFIKDGKWYVSTVGVEARLVDYHDDWWQPWALKWLLKHGYLCEEE